MRAPRLVRRSWRVFPKLVLPVVLALAIVSGGASGEGFQAQAALLAGAGCLAALCLASWDSSRPVTGMVALLGFLLAYAALGLAHLIPLPADLVFGLPGRGVIGEGWQLLGVEAGTAPLSMAPERTLRAIGSAIIPLAGVLLVYRLGWSRSAALLPWAIALAGAASGLYGFAQVLVAGEGDLYFYDFTSRGLPVGFFANANHQASFLLMTLPFTAALIGEARAEGRSRDSEGARLIILASLGLVQLVGVLAVGSVAGYILLAPTLLLSLVIMASRRRNFSGRSGAVLVAALVAGALLVASSPVLEGLGVTSFSTDGMSRFGMASVAREALGDHIWLGSGLGTFEPVFKLYEDPALVTRTFANHAHNEYLQWALETGLPGLVLLGGFLVWWFLAFFRIWTKLKDDTARIRKAASVVTLIVFLHSFVDYPARTPAVLALASVCLALMVVPRRQAAPREVGQARASKVEL